MDRKTMVLFVSGAVAVGAVSGAAVLSQGRPEPTTTVSAGDGVNDQGTNDPVHATNDPGTTTDDGDQAASTDTLRTFGSDDAFRSFVASLQQQAQGRGGGGYGSGGGDLGGLLEGAMAEAPAAAAPPAPPTA
ncbi:MAG: hypothetical protein J0L92_33785, partial [Deltaproteobacteria bacterium]|nr:hypothetical protein [Deltaproteobacteria bacterium]